MCDCLQNKTRDGLLTNQKTPFGGGARFSLPISWRIELKHCHWFNCMFLFLKYHYYYYLETALVVLTWPVTLTTRLVTRTRTQPLRNPKSTVGIGRIISCLLKRNLLLPCPPHTYGSYTHKHTVLDGVTQFESTVTRTQAPRLIVHTSTEAPLTSSQRNINSWGCRTCLIKWVCHTTCTFGLALVIYGRAAYKCPDLAVSQISVTRVHLQEKCVAERWHKPQKEYFVHTSQ